MEFEMHWGETPVARGDSREIFGRDELRVGDQVASGIRAYQVLSVTEQPNGVAWVEVEPA